MQDVTTRGICVVLRGVMKVRSVLVVALVPVLAAGLAACGGSKKANTQTAIGIGAVAQAHGTADIGAARRSSPNFKIFPSQVSSIACQIPRGGPYVPGKMRLNGTCATRLRTYHPPKGIKGGHGTVGTVEVVFTERWHYPASSKRWWHATWFIPVRQGQVLKGAARVTGATPPQSWI